MGLTDRMIRAAKLDVSLYEEVEADPAATNQALLVVIVASVCSGIGSGVRSLLAGLEPVKFTIGLVGGVVLALVGWLIWSFITYFIGRDFSKDRRPKQPTESSCAASASQIRQVCWPYWVSFRCWAD